MQRLDDSISPPSCELLTVTVSSARQIHDPSFTRNSARLPNMSTHNDDTVNLERLSLANSATSSDLATAPEYSGPHPPLKLVRNGKVDTPNDYAHIFTKLQLEGNFQEEFFEIIKEYRSRADVKEALEDPENDLKAISEDFLKTYGKKIWMLRGANNKQDPKYRETFFKWKDDEDKLGTPNCYCLFFFSQSVSLGEPLT
jgi:hypothetical protein